MDLRHRLFVGYVLRDSAADEVNGLRRALGSSELERIPPHITLIPPFNVAGGELVDAYRLIANAGAGTVPLGLSLGGPQTFPPDHHVIYLEVGGDLEGLQLLRERCLHHPLVPSNRRNERPFVAHVTLRSHADHSLVAHARAALAHFNRSMVVDRLTLLSFDAERPTPRWEICDEVMIGGVVVLGRGGREISVVQASMRNLEDVALLIRNGCVVPGGGLADTLPGRSRPEYPLVVLRAMVANKLVGLCCARHYGPFFEVEYFVIDTDERRTGIGRQLAAFLERLAKDLLVRELRAVVANDVVAFFEECGYTIGPRTFDRATTRVVRELRIIEPQESRNLPN